MSGKTKNHYTYLIKNLVPNDERQFYIGVKSCDCLPEENTDYMGSSSSLCEDIELHGLANFQKIILQEFNSREEAEIHENALHIEHNAASNPLFYNKKNGVIGFHVTDESTSNMIKTKSSKEWKETKGKAADQKHKETINDPLWKATTRKQIIKKYKETVNDPQWKETVGEDRRRKNSEIRNDPNWKETSGINRNKNHKDTLNDPQWKETTGKEQRRKQKETVNDSLWKDTKGKERNITHKATIRNPDWIKANTFVCPHCKKSMVGRGNFVRYHGDKCKIRLNQ